MVDAIKYSQKQLSKREHELHLKVNAQATAMKDGFLEISPRSEDDYDKFDDSVKFTVAKAPYLAWARGSYLPALGWSFVCPSGIKCQMDDRNHSDWWLGVGISIRYAYSWGTSEYDDANPRDEKIFKLARQLEQAAWDSRYKFNEARRGKSIFLHSAKQVIKGRVHHIKTDKDILEFAQDTLDRKNPNITCNKDPRIAVVADASIKYDSILRQADAIITCVGSAASHLVKVAREGKSCPVILCEDAFNEYLHWEKITIEGKQIY